MNIDNYIQTGILLVAVITVIFSHIKMMRQSRQIIFTEYTRRYNDILLHMPDEVFEGTAHTDARTLKYMRLYFDLCSEEYHLQKKKLIDNNTWNIWLEGMQTTCNYEIYRTSWKALGGLFDKDFWHFFEHEVINHKKGEI